MSQPQSKEIMQSHINRLLVDSSMNPNNIETKYEKEGNISLIYFLFDLNISFQKCL